MATPYILRTKDGLRVTIPGNIPRDSEEARRLVEAARAKATARAAGPAAALTPALQATPDAIAQEALARPAPEEMGFFETLGELITGAQRATPETEQLPQYRDMPELRGAFQALARGEPPPPFDLERSRAAFATAFAGPDEIADIIKSSFPGIEISRDMKGNYLMRSPEDNQVYAIPPGVSRSDIPGIVGSMVLFGKGAGGVALSQAGARAALLAAGKIAGRDAAIQTGIEGAQAQAGGAVDLAPVGIAGALPLVPAAVGAGAASIKAAKQRAAQAAEEAAAQIPPEGGFKRRAGDVATPAASPLASPLADTPAVPQATHPLRRADDVLIPRPVKPVEAQESILESDFLDLVGEAIGTPSRRKTVAARTQLAKQVDADPALVKNAEELGLDVPIELLASPKVLSLTAAARAEPLGKLALQRTMTQASTRFDELLKQRGAVFSGEAPSLATVSERIRGDIIGTQESLRKAASAGYAEIDGALAEDALVKNLPHSKALIEGVVRSLRGRRGLTEGETRLARLVSGLKPRADDPTLQRRPLTYEGLRREIEAVSDVYKNPKSPYADMPSTLRKRVSTALRLDKLHFVTQEGDEIGEPLGEILKEANKHLARQKSIEKRIVEMYSKDTEGSIAGSLKKALGGAITGEKEHFNKVMKLLKELPDKNLQKEALATSFAEIIRGGGKNVNSLDIDKFATYYPRLKANPPVFEKFAETQGKDGIKLLDNMHALTRQLINARDYATKTGAATRDVINDRVQAQLTLVDKMTRAHAQKPLGYAGVELAAFHLLGVPSFVATFMAWRTLQRGLDKMPTSTVLLADLLGDKAFQSAARQMAITGKIKPGTLDAAIKSSALRRFFERLKIDYTPSRAEKFLTTGLQTGRLLYVEDPEKQLRDAHEARETDEGALTPNLKDTE